ncbi:hypothetical protein DL98DRAFT_657859 [Cadophora sp. DSE1049]|nr:hypothetical protein DL98DRAFT_657859 [Cadophora sp. DSE1049]
MFRDQTSFQLTPFFDSDSFRILVLQACNVPAIRHVVIAIGALAKACMTFHEQKDRTMEQHAASPRMHHGAAIKEYSKALGLMREASSQGRQNLRTTLITSLLIACFECCHGNYALANAQIESGITLIQSWRNSYPGVASIFSTPAPDVVEDLLIRIFGGLEIQSNLLGARYTTEQHREMMYVGEDILQSMPVHFDNLETVRAYLQLTVKRLLHWMHSLDLSHTTDIEAEAEASTNVQFQQGCAQEQFLHDLVSDSSMNPSTFQFEYIHYRSQLDRWMSSFNSLLQQSPFVQEDLAVTLLRLGYRSCLLLLNTIIGQENGSMEEDTLNITEIIHDSNIAVDRLRARSNTHFMVLQGMVDPARLSEVVKQSSRQARLEAVGMLFRWPRSEGKSESLFVGTTLNCARSAEGNESIAPATREGGSEDIFEEDLLALEIAYQDLLAPDGNGNWERRSSSETHFL